jgi:hypothetical protein
MNHIRNIVFAAAVLALTAGAALATGGPNPNSVVVIPRMFNDCPSSILTVTNHYPSSLNITDEVLDCGGFANLHVWRYSRTGRRKPSSRTGPRSTQVPPLDDGHVAGRGRSRGRALVVGGRRQVQLPHDGR